MKEITVVSKVYGTVKSIVDDDVYDYLIKFRWSVSKDKGNLYLVARKFYEDDKLKKVKMHQMIMMPYDKSKFIIDHKNRNTLDNTKANLRLATVAQNNWNRKPQSNKKVPFKGVVKSYKSYLVEIMVNGKRIKGGTFNTPEEAALKYNELARIHHGEFAYQNKV